MAYKDSVHNYKHYMYKAHFFFYQCWKIWKIEPAHSNEIPENHHPPPNFTRLFTSYVVNFKKHKGLKTNFSHCSAAKT